MLIALRLNDMYECVLCVSMLCVSVSVSVGL